jgi:hypothetical protein
VNTFNSLATNGISRAAHLDHALATVSPNCSCNILQRVEVSVNQDILGRVREWVPELVERLQEKRILKENESIEVVIPGLLCRGVFDGFIERSHSLNHRRISEEYDLVVVSSVHFVLPHSVELSGEEFKKTVSDVTRARASFRASTGSEQFFFRYVPLSEVLPDVLGLERVALELEISCSSQPRIGMNAEWHEVFTDEEVNLQRLIRAQLRQLDFGPRELYDAKMALFDEGSWRVLSSLGLSILNDNGTIPDPYLRLPVTDYVFPDLTEAIKIWAYNQNDRISFCRPPFWVSDEAEAELSQWKRSNKFKLLDVLKDKQPSWIKKALVTQAHLHEKAEWAQYTSLERPQRLVA